MIFLIILRAGLEKRERPKNFGFSISCWVGSKEKAMPGFLPHLVSSVLMRENFWAMALAEGSWAAPSWLKAVLRT